MSNFLQLDIEKSSQIVNHICEGFLMSNCEKVPFPSGLQRYFILYVNSASYAYYCSYIANLKILLLLCITKQLGD